MRIGAQQQCDVGPVSIFGSDQVFWRRSDSGITASGGAIDSWNGTGPNATSTTINRPADGTASATLNSARAADFDGSNDYLTVASAIQASNASYLMWFIVDPDDAPAAGRTLFASYTNVGAEVIYVCNSSGASTGYVATYDGIGWREFAVATTGPQALMFDLRAGVATAKAYRNEQQLGGAQDWTARPIGPGVGGGVKIGSIYDASAWFLNGRMVECGIAINPSDLRRTQLAAYIRARYAALYAFENHVATVAALSSVTGLWLADRGLTITSGKVSAWASHKAGPSAYAQATAGARPVPVDGFGTGRPAILFDGADDYLSGGVHSEVMSASTGAVYALYKPEAITSNGASAYANHTVWATEGAYAGFAFKDPISNKVGAYNYDGNYDEIYPVCPGTVRQVGRWRHAGGNLYMRIDAGAESSTASGNTQVMQVQRLGGNPGATGVFSNMKLAALVTLNADPSAGDDTAIMALLNAY